MKKDVIMADGLKGTASTPQRTTRENPAEHLADKGSLEKYSNPCEENSKMAAELKRLSPRHMKMVELALQGHTNSQIAEQCGVGRECVTWVMGSAHMQNELARRRQGIEKVHDDVVASVVVRAQEKIQSLAMQAAEKLEEHLVSQDARISMMSVKEILDRAGASTAGKSATVQILSPERVNLVLMAIQESKGEAA